MNNQNQNINPDYSFITNQTLNKPKKTGRGKIIIICLLLAVTAVLIVVTLLFSPKNKTTSQSSPTAQQAQKYLQLIGASNYKAAYGMLSTSLTANMPLESFQSTTSKALNNINLGSCQTITSSQSQLGTERIAFYCLHKDKRTYVKIEIGLDKKMAITGVYII